MRVSGVMLQGGGAYPAAQAGEMLNLVAAYSANPLDPKWLMETLGLTEAVKTTYRRLSGGQQQRLALACAVVGRPELVFLDEPTAGMDAHARIVVWELIEALRARRRDRRADHTSTDRGRGTGRPAGDHRPRRRGGQRNPRRADAQRRREPAAVLRTPNAGPVAADFGAAGEAIRPPRRRRASTWSRATSIRRCWRP